MAASISERLILGVYQKEKRGRKRTGERRQEPTCDGCIHLLFARESRGDREDRGYGDEGEERVQGENILVFRSVLAQGWRKGVRRSAAPLASMRGSQFVVFFLLFVQNLYCFAQDA